jgi:hypothetical protein
MLKLTPKTGETIEVTGQGRLRIHVGPDGRLAFEDDARCFEIRRVGAKGRRQASSDEKGAPRRCGGRE